MQLLPDGVHDFLHAPGWSLRSLAWRALHPKARVVQPVFVIGAPRSGCALTVSLFGTHPEVANWSEAGRLWDPVHYHDPEADHAFAPERATRARIRRLHRWCAWYAESRGKARFVNGHARNAMRLGYLRRVFPDARFVHVIRDGRAVVGSIVFQVGRRERRQARPLGGFARPPGWRALVRDDLAEQAALQWQAVVRHVREQAAELGPAYTEVRFEAVRARPRETIRALFDFAGLRSGDAALAGVPETLDAAERWRERLDAEQLATVEKAAGPLLRELGY
jgi:omega-hydroxy-beta-dihydromenaquinone-9 sulfotransferase